MTPPQNSSKNALVYISLGCGGAIGLGMVSILWIILSVVSGIGSLFQEVWRSSGGHQTHQLATDTLRSHPEAIAELGEPISTGWASQISMIGEKTCLRFAVFGSKRSGSTYAEATKQNNAWYLHQLTIAVNGKKDPLVIVALPAENPNPLCPNFDAEAESSPGKSTDEIES
ncbi:MAG: cytochrome c oxidase assembly factor Coa1 family protein [Spirulina sp.]